MWQPGLSCSLPGTLTGSGGLVKTGDGALYLTGTSSYSGGTTISAGTLQWATATPPARSGQGMWSTTERWCSTGLTM
ncbi:autotransporter-associated beta strand repeat-containing protein [Pannonibacter phragmitetus]|uniref:autotransporter-associated beta strand repeat-containing protein n=1 Tax=Pannonibacter phragmitetus TaxID=121719 RepID=UPI003D7EB687